MAVVALIGRPNTGKSTLFNRLAGHRQAVTDAQAGTTRDAVTAEVEWGRARFTLIDTAGLEPTAGDIGQQLKDQIQAAASAADLLVVVVDAGTMLTPADLAAAKLAHQSGRPVLLAVNKNDTAQAGPVDKPERLGIKPAIRVSAIHGQGTGDLLDAIVKQLPKKRQPAVKTSLKLALIGRPNVGKSSLLNALAGTPRAITSATAGTTRDAITTAVEFGDQTVTVTDTAGLRKRGRITPGVEKFSTLRTITAVRDCDIAVVVMDANEPATAGDQHIAGLAANAGKGIILVANKWDAVEKDDQTQAQLGRRITHEFQFCHWAPLVFTSATTGRNVAKILELAAEINTRRQLKIPTTQLNRWLQAAAGTQPPAGLKNRQPKLRYATQTGTNPPTFTIFGSHTNFLHFSYRRYLENSLRQIYDFTGTPIQLDFKDNRAGERV